MYIVTFEMKAKLRNVVVRIKSHNKTNMDAFTFTATVASKGYHIYKTTSWINAKDGDKATVELETTASSSETDPYACAIRIKNKYFSNLKTVGPIPRKISQHVHYFIKAESGKINWNVKSLTYRPSPILSGGLEIPLQLTFLSWQREILDFMNIFINSLFYDWNYTGIVNPEEDEENDTENTDDENFGRTSSNSNKCDNVIVLD